MLALMLIGAYALNFSYDGEIFIEPGEERAVSIYIQSVNETGVYWMSCSSSLSVSCPNYIQVQADKEMEVLLNVHAELGEHPVNVTVGNKLIQFTVKSSNQTYVFYNTLAQYKETFSRLELRHGPHHLIELGKLLLSEGFVLYEKEEFRAVDGIAGNLDGILTEYYNEIQVIHVEEQPARLNLSFISIALVGAMFVLYVHKSRKPQQRPGTDEIGVLVQKEFGGVSVGEEERKT